MSVDGNLVWVDLTGYAEAEVRQVADLLGLHAVAVRATLSAWHRPRLDVFDRHFFVTATIPRALAAERRVHAGQLDLFVGSNFLVSAHKLPLPFADQVLARAKHNPELIRLDSAFLLYIILDELLEYAEGIAEGLGSEIEAMEERALRDTSDTYLEDLLQLKRYVFAIGRLLDQHREVLAAFGRPDWRFAAGNDDVKPYFRDLVARLDHLLSDLTGAKEAVNGAFGIYVSHVSHRTNQIMKVLTVVSTIVLPTTVIAAIFSAGFEGLPTYGPWALIAMVLLTLVLNVVTVMAFRRRGWL